MYVCSDMIVYACSDMVTMVYAHSDMVTMVYAHSDMVSGAEYINLCILSGKTQKSSVRGYPLLAVSLAFYLGLGYKLYVSLFYQFVLHLC